MWADALVYEHVSGSGNPPFKYAWPGIIATLALLLINAVSRDDLAEISSSGDQGDDVSVVTYIFSMCINFSFRSVLSLQTRARLWLLFSFLLAVAAVGGSVAVLVNTTQAEKFAAVGVVGFDMGFTLKQSIFIKRKILSSRHFTGFCCSVWPHFSIVPPVLGI